MAKNDNPTKVNFKPKARLMHLLGDNLLKDEVTAIIELVKNAHDADATKCIIHFESSGGQQRVIIEDDGTGMDVSTVTTAWIEPGTSYKIRKPTTKKHRRVLGDKGIGRFAVDKIAKRLDLYTKTEEMKDVIHFEVNWGIFDDNDKYLDDIGATYTLKKMDFMSHGTKLILTNLRKTWGRSDIEKMRIGLMKLLPPSGITTDFEIKLDLPDYRDLEGVIRNDIVQNAHFKIVAVEKDGVVAATISRNLPLDKNTTTKKIIAHDFNADKIIDREELRKLGTGPITIEIGAFLKIRHRGKSRKTVFPTVTLSEADEAILDEWHGISVYSDNFWVYPYGEDWFNWLNLDQRRVQSPGTKFDSKQLVGFVKISKDGNPGLVQQINREGLVHNEAYHLLRSLVLSVIAELEADAVVSGARRRQKDTENPTVVSATSNVQDNVNDLDNIVDSLAIASDKLKTGHVEDGMNQLNLIMSKVTSVKKSVSREMIIYDKFAALGKFAGYVIHQINLAIDPVALTVDTLKNILSSITFQDAQTYNQVSEILADLESDLQNLSEQVNKWEMFTVKDATKEKIEICNFLRKFKSEFELLYKEMRIEIECNGSMTVNITKSDLWNILSNLIDNSYYWTKGLKDPFVRITASENEDLIRIRVSDNGRGVQVEDQDKIFMPGYSTKPQGKGLGLMIAATASWRLDGELVFLKNSEIDNGATFELSIPR